MLTQLSRAIAARVEARANCERTSNTEWHAKHTQAVEELCKQHMPSGSGFDTGTLIDWSRSTAERLVFTVDYHHMDDNGSYDGWTLHDVIVTASLVHGISIRIAGRDRNGFKEYAHDVFHDALMTMVHA